MEFGIKLPNLSALYGRDPIMRMAKKADDLGFEFVWASDHVVFPAEEDARADIGPRSFPITYRENAVDPLTALAFAAGATERVKLGTSGARAAVPQSDRDGQAAGLNRHAL